MKTTFSFLSSNGHTQVKAYRWTPERTPFKAIVQLTHGMTEHMNRYDSFATFLSQQGILVVGHDHLGHGLTAEKSEDLGYFDPAHPSDALVADMHILRTSTQKDYPDLPYFMLGHSMGSYMLRKYLFSHAQGLSGAVIMGTGDVPKATCELGMTLARCMALFRGWHYRSPMLQKLSTGGGPYKQYCLDGSQADRSWLTKDTEIVRAYYKDPLCTFRFTLNGYLGLFEAVRDDGMAENIRKMPQTLPILLVSGQDDPVGDLGEGVRRVEKRFRDAGMQDVTCTLYAGDRHEILNELDRKKVYSDILQWITERL